MNIGLLCVQVHLFGVIQCWELLLRYFLTTNTYRHIHVSTLRQERHGDPEACGNLQRNIHRGQGQSEQQFIAPAAGQVYLDPAGYMSQNLRAALNFCLSHEKGCPSSHALELPGGLLSRVLRWHGPISTLATRPELPFLQIGWWMKLQAEGQVGLHFLSRWGLS